MPLDISHRVKRILQGLNVNNSPAFECPPVGQTEEELLSCLSIVKAIQPEVIVEIGSASGGHIYLLSCVLDPNRRHSLISIDPWLGKYSQHKKTYNATVKALKLHFGENFTYSSICAVSQVEETKNQLCKKLNGKAVDFLFIDGSHSGFDISDDWRLYQNLVCEEGVVCLHDIEGEPDVAATWGIIQRAISPYRHTWELKVKGIPLLPGLHEETVLGLGIVPGSNLSLDFEKYGLVSPTKFE